MLDDDIAATVLGHIKANNFDTRDRCTAMFEKWLLSRNATWNKLIAVLEKVKLTFLADDIKRRLSTIPGK